MPAFSFWQRWLLTVGLAITVFGIVMAVLSGTPVFGLFNGQIDPAFWGVNEIGDPAKQFQQWVYGVWGSTVAGWGIFITYIARYPFSRKERWAWNCVLIGIVVWFVLDTLLSLLHRVYFNVAFNTALLILVLLPIVGTRKDFEMTNG